MTHRTLVAQRGMAVISALLVVAAAAVIAASMLDRQSTQVRILESEKSQVQGRAMLLGGIDWARIILRADARRSAVTRGDQVWATPIADMRVSQEGDDQEAVFSGRIEDEQGKYNLQNLARNGQVRPDQIAALTRLLHSVGVPVDSVPLLAQRMAMAQARPAAGDAQGAGNPGDAGGSNTAGTPGNSSSAANAGAAGGTGTAGGIDAPSLPGTALAPGLRSVDDLRAFNFDEAAMQNLQPYITVLPTRTAVNVNTAPAEVLSAVIGTLSLAQAIAIADQRDRGQYFNNQADFQNRLGDPAIKIPDGAVTTTSQWFGVTGTVRVEQASVDMRALLRRDAQTAPSVVWMMEAN